MKQRWTHKIFTVAAFVLLVLPLSGCRLWGMTISIPDFDGTSIDGVSFWRLSDRIEGEDCYDVGTAIECYDHVGGVVFESIEVRVDLVDETVTRRILTFSNTNDLDGELGTRESVLEEVEGSAVGEVSMSLLFLDLVDEPGTYRIKTYNAAGVSPISSQSIVY